MAKNSTRFSRTQHKRNKRVISALKKCPTGISGLDEITEGGLPLGRPTLICGSAGCGKTLLAMEFISRGITEFNEPGVFMAFEETTEELATNVASLGMNLKEHIRQKKLAIDYVYIERSEIEETGEYDLEGLFVRLGNMIDSIGAKRVVLDTIEALFAGFSNEAVLRAELRRLFRWLKTKKVTTIITGEKGEKHLTRNGLEEYVSDCVILLDHRIVNEVATRRLRIVKYRGSKHGTNEYPTIIDENGLSVLPISSLGLTYPVSNDRIPTGIDRLDTMFGGKGYFRGTSVLVSGTAGSGKTSIAAAFADKTCRKGEKCIYFSFEESPEQIKRNMGSVGINLNQWEGKGLLKFHSTRPTLYGLEAHLVRIHKLVEEFHPTAVIMDPITNLAAIGESLEVKSMLTRIIDYLKNKQITTVFTSLTEGGGASAQSEVGISSLMDTWILLRHLETDGERNRLLYVLKSRGMAHSNQVREFVLSGKGVHLRDVYIGAGAVLTGSAREVQESKDNAQKLSDKQSSERRQRALRQQHLTLKGQVEALKVQLAGLAEELRISADAERCRIGVMHHRKKEMSLIRKAD
ncbi:MAG: KaiC 1 [Candidatus Raymondbacteria bacterium RifOxyA12_full_50_37]|uniref:non-specific serine/threonine protein kinase n=1 Tax=Candidatus Raymondbacteria bacterium RIFOXYD12_FULL_49_13 TaxID=1817890 RepID=A0A1F7F4Q9_UNCRA|nr:MAG: KaiC 1 [Candidatus Raymondbacteria bacterium RifOxyA12_full_50_37]OGJ91901.1 MAG: KaiC 1 [Candidatus Raymondbacteria bacterium RIFOXYA2_FULL_49_16]OGJ91942.1 MAG: KaiC 1 [Candidatus Raymondbacteria bacterium RifOxyB12_full_50_8]OGJ96015.1 MAG: KaiC 1 [Candidatus Raymondbacteria bacterium RifOxyC12_full_50_8]OGJ98061.1 MAG: KaiC 1 [Candidatus Raymondbacteria bacterium RIFOXYC2_FULL_50_21]OGK01650.1 MAG: KaiC 1 [Candidatus Raymondbacteria bacterium RIFOXYD12_FULL_49_13]OGP44007.1 MAG: K